MIVLYCIYAFWVVITRRIKLRSTTSTAGYGIFWVPPGESSCPDGSEYVWHRQERDGGDGQPQGVQDERGQQGGQGGMGLLSGQGHKEAEDGQVPPAEERETFKHECVTRKLLSTGSSSK